MAQTFRLIFIDCAIQLESFHQPDGSQWQPDAMLQNSALVKIQLQAAAAEIENHPRLRAISQGPLHRLATQPRLLFAADYFQFNSGLAPYPIHQSPMVARLARRRRRHRAIRADVVLVHAVPELPERTRGPIDRVASDDVPGEGVVT